MFPLIGYILLYFIQSQSFANCYLNIYRVGLNKRWIQVRSATRFKDCVKTSLGVLNPNLFLGRLFNCC